MSINLGSNSFGLYLGSTKISEAYIGNVKVLNGGLPELAPNSLRFKFYDATFTPVAGTHSANGTWTKVNNSGVWDWTYSSSWANAFSGKLLYSNINTYCDILESNNITSNTFTGMFKNCSSIKQFANFKNAISGSIYANEMFYGCSELESSPIASISNIYTMEGTFYNCGNMSNMYEQYKKFKLSDAGKYGRYNTNSFKNGYNTDIGRLPSIIGGTKTATRTNLGTIASGSGTSGSGTYSTITLRAGDSFVLEISIDTTKTSSAVASFNTNRSGTSIEWSSSNYSSSNKKSFSRTVTTYLGYRNLSSYTASFNNTASFSGAPSGSTWMMYGSKYSYDLDY